MGDLQTRRAIVQGMDSEGHYQKVSAKIPLAEMYKYNASLRALSKGRAKYTRAFSNYQSVPRDMQKRLVSEHKGEEAVMA